MQLKEAKIRVRGKGSLLDYCLLIKPRETGLLVFIGVITAIMAGGGAVTTGRLVLTMAAILIASAGANGLTNYLDRDLDARMQRTMNRVLPAGRIYPAERALVFTAGLTAVGLVMAWYLHPLAFLSDMVGTAAAVIYRKRVTCVFPQGLIAGCAPVLMGWFAVRYSFDWEILLLCILIAVWLPSHIWSIMVAHQEDYRNAGITYFPLNCSTKAVTRILFAFSILLYAASIGLFFTGGFGLIYLVTANLAGAAVVYASWRLMRSNASGDAWKLYKLSAFPYLGVVFLMIGLDIWLRF
ncbi:MAG: protoheme IX farnesyltransferase [Dehalococcoidales bacterium]|nr:protoheme IX farnesyltransferase [Dehalococcoidales bacterium]